MSGAAPLELETQRLAQRRPTDAGYRRALRVRWRDPSSGARWSSFTLHGEPGESFEDLEHRAAGAAASVYEHERAGR